MPRPLVDLCESLLELAPRDRPRCDQILVSLRTLAGEGATPRSTTPFPAALGVGPAPFVGRTDQLAALRSAWARARRGELAVVCLRGASGMGKTALVRRFLSEVHAGREGVVLEGRCHEREALGFKALDGIVDGLGQLLASMPQAESAALRPEGIEDLERLFPVLRSKARPSLENAASAGQDDGDLRRRAFDVLRELLRRLAARRPVLLFIDDIQWGDDDSAALLRALLRPDHAPPLLLLASCRPEADLAPAFASLLDALASSGRCEELLVEPLGLEEARSLAEALLGPGHAEIAAITAEARGVPFLVDALVEEVRERAATHGGLNAEMAAQDGDAAGQDLRLRTVIGARVRRLPEPAQRLLEIIALAGKPVARAVVEAAADISPWIFIDSYNALDSHAESDFERLLRARRLVRLSSDGISLETFHDRIRDGVTAAMPANIRMRLHGRLARALAGHGTADPEDLAHHFAAAGENDAAATLAVLAAQRRTEGMAFDRAAALYATAIELRGAQHPDTGTLTVKRAEALAAAGHGVAAGEAFLAAAERLPAERATLTCRGGQELLRAGDVARGRSVLEIVLRSLGWRVPRTAIGTFLAVVVRRVGLALRGLRAPPAGWSPGPRTRDNFLRMDASFCLAANAMMLDTVQATYYQTHNLRIAIAEQEPFRFAQALGLEAIAAALPGGRSPARADRILDLLRKVTQSAGHPIMNGLAPLAESVVAANRGEWRRAHDRSLLATEQFAAHGAGVAWEMSTARAFLLFALVNMGRFREYAARFPRFLEDSRARGDLYAEAVLALSACSYIVPLKDDRVAAAKAAVDAALGTLPHGGFQIPKLWGRFSKVDIALYEGDAARAWHLLSEKTSVWRSLLLYVQTIRVHVRHQRGRVAIAMAARTRGTKAGRRFLALAARQARALEHERLSWSTALALALRGGIAECQGDLDSARKILAEADGALRAVDMDMHAASVRLARGNLVGGSEGAALVSDAEGWMRAQDVRRPERVAATVYPQ